MFPGKYSASALTIGALIAATTFTTFLPAPIRGQAAPARGAAPAPAAQAAPAGRGAAPALTARQTQLRKAVDDAYAKFKPGTKGKNADYIPYLAKVDSNLFGVSVVTTDGQAYS